MKNKVKDILDYLNKRFNQDSPEYSIFNGSKPQVIRFNTETAISLWACGAIVCIGSSVIFFQEDDGSFFCDEYVRLDDISNIDFWSKYPVRGIQSSFSLAWAESFIKAFQELNDYVKLNGTPYYYSGSNVICGYELK